MNPDLCRAILETDITALDIQSLGYRREQLTNMRQLLDNPGYFEDQKLSLGENKGPEDVWQNFFESNQWIFGFALDYAIGEGAIAEKLEQVVAGADIGGAGKRVDALLRTRGIVQSLCYVEIKRHDTKLVTHSPYRKPDVFRPSAELSGGIAQSQKTVQKAMERLGTEMQGKYNYSPRAVLVCGSLSEFVGDDDQIDEEMFSSFELFRRNVPFPDIVTFDELYERAHAVVESGIDKRKTT